jgi:hypothetical protein
MRGSLHCRLAQYVAIAAYGTFSKHMHRLYESGFTTFLTMPTDQAGTSSKAAEAGSSSKAAATAGCCGVHSPEGSSSDPCRVHVQLRSRYGECFAGSSELRRQQCSSLQDKFLQGLLFRQLPSLKHLCLLKTRVSFIILTPGCTHDSDTRMYLRCWVAENRPPVFREFIGEGPTWEEEARHALYLLIKTSWCNVKHIAAGCTGFNH